MVHLSSFLEGDSRELGAALAAALGVTQAQVATADGTGPVALGFGARGEGRHAGID